MLDIGLAPNQPGVGIDVRGLEQVIDYPARDMTITVQAGITMARLQGILAAEHQRVPLDVPRADQATLGGVLATNTSGPRRLGFGSARDYVIGISAINDAGQEYKAGGRVVKNVAGYDLCKLLVGSLGTLGIITQVTLKLRPLPEERALVTFGCDTARLEGLLDRLHASRSRPVVVDALNDASVHAMPQAGLPESPWVLAVGFEDSCEVVAWQMRQLQDELRSENVCDLQSRLGLAGDLLWQALVEFRLLPDAQLTFQANLLPRATAAFCRLAAELPEQPRLQVHAGNGIVIGQLTGDLTLERTAAMLTLLREQATAAEGNLVLPRCPPAWKATLPVWGTPRGDAWLMRQIKDQLDPQRRFNPGRFVDGI